MDERLRREQAFHNRIFGANARVDAEKYYAVIRASRARYLATLDETEPGRRALELGCGPGSNAFRLAARGVHVTGIDISDVAIEQARAHAAELGLSEHAHFEVMNAEALSFPDSTFELICGTGILHHLHLATALRELQRTLRPEGTAIFVEPLGHNPLLRLYRWATPLLRTPDEHPLLLTDLEEARRHFGEVEVDYFHLATLAAVPFRGRSYFPSLVGGLERLDAALFRSLPSTRRLAWQAIVRLGRPIGSSAVPVSSEATTVSSDEARLVG